MKQGIIASGHLTQITLGHLAEVYNTTPKTIRRVLENHDGIYEDDANEELIDTLLITNQASKKYLKAMVVVRVFHFLGIPDLCFPPGLKAQEIRNCYGMSRPIFRRSLVDGGIPAKIRDTFHNRMIFFPFQLRAIIDDFGEPDKPFVDCLDEDRKYWIGQNQRKYSKFIQNAQGLY